MNKVCKNPARHQERHLHFQSTVVQVFPETNARHFLRMCSKYFCLFLFQTIIWENGKKFSRVHRQRTFVIYNPFALVRERFPDFDTFTVVKEKIVFGLKKNIIFFFK